MRVAEKSFFLTLLKFTPNWDYKPTNEIQAVSPGVYTSDKILNSIAKDKVHLKCDVIAGFVVNGTREPISFISDKPSGFEVFCEATRIHYKK